MKVTDECSGEIVPFVAGGPPPNENRPVEKSTGGPSSNENKPVLDFRHASNITVNFNY